MTLDIRDYVPGDIYRVVGGDFDSEGLRLIAPALDQFRVEAKTCIAARGIIGVAGIKPEWPGRGTAWTHLGEITKREWVVIRQAMREMIRASFVRHGLRRVEAHVRSDWEPGADLMRSLSFRREGRLRAWTPDGVDHDMWSVIHA